MRALRPIGRWRAYAYGLVTTALVVVFALAEHETENYVTDRSRLAGRAIEITIALLAALAFRPLQQRVELLVEAAFTKRRREAREALAHLQKELTSFRDVQQVLRRVVEAVDRHMSTAGCAIYLWRDRYMAEASSFDVGLENVDANDTLAVRLRSAAEPADPRTLHSAAHGELAFPMMAGGELVGFLTLTPKRIEYDADDRHALSMLAEAAGVALLAIDARLRPSDEPRTNLPQQVTSFVGRETEISELTALLRECRLVTLAGPGGVGKTRVSLQVATKLLDAEVDQFPDGVWFADLAPLSDPSLVVNTIGRIFQLQETPDQAKLESLTGFLKTRKLLLILDNCEHVIGEAVKIASSIQQCCPDVRILATSREALNVAGEVVYRMPSLAVPGRSKHISPQEALSFGAVALFEERGRNVKPAFAITDENAEAVAEVCRHLDGIPLAIELAAARLRLLTPHQLAVKLDERLRLLTGGDRAALPRQQTMRALIDWSYDLLAAPEQTVFRAMSAFVGGFAIEAATALCENGSLDEIGVLDLVTSLVDKSLVLAEPWEDMIRYRLLESMREYARDKLRSAGERDETLERHARIYADFTEQLAERYEELTPRAWSVQAEAEIENLRAALSWAFSQVGNVLVGQRIAVTIPRVFGAVAPAEGHRWVVTAIDRIDDTTPPSIVAGLELAQATIASVFNHFNVALRAARRALALFTELGQAAGIADAQRFVGRSLVYTGQLEEGAALLQEALSSQRSRGSRRSGSILGDLAVARALQNDVAGARALFSQAWETFQETADASKLAITAATLAEAEFRAGSAEEALRLGQDAAAGARSLGRFRTLAAILNNIAAYELYLHLYEDARTHASESLDLFCDGQSDDVLFVFALQHLAAAATLKSCADAQSATADHTRAAHLLGFVEGRLPALEITREYTEQCGYAQLLEVLRQAMGSDFESMLEIGKTWSVERAIAEVRLLP
ncbi:MAG: GAF domain-containing protein [Candidatus Aquilonibacter sp.]